jgi:hypothetical protein
METMKLTTLEREAQQCERIHLRPLEPINTRQENTMNEELTKEQAKALIEALRTNATQHLLMVARLSGGYQRDAQACVDIARKALEGAGEKL